MKAAGKLIALALLAFLLTTACNSGGGSGVTAIDVYLVGEWSGCYQEDGGGSHDLKASIPHQSGNRFSGTFRESPIGEEYFDGTVDAGCEINITSPAGLKMEGLLEGYNDMSGYYETSDGHSGYWELSRQ